MAKAEHEAPSECLNCGTVLQGQWCHECGQKAKAQVRHFGSVVTDILDTVFEYDNRIWRTLLPLYFIPGKISTDFMAGRRVRYVLPFRLFFVLSVVMFLTLQFSAIPERLVGLNLVADSERFAAFDSESEIIAERDRLIAELQGNLQELESDSGAGVDLARSGLRAAIRVINDTSEARLAELRDPDGQPSGSLQNGDINGAAAADMDVLPTPGVLPDTPASPTPPETLPGIVFAGGQVWHPETNPLVIDWLSPQINTAINSAIERALLNLRGVSENPAQLIEAMLSLLPLVLFFMMPVFALLLKIFYLFSKRLYMEHFIVALHSHSFLFFAVLISLLLNALSTIASLPGWVSELLLRLYWISLIWIPIYLLLMQRRVYAQGWILTFIKYNVIGTLYMILLFFALLAAAAISLIRL